MMITMIPITKNNDNDNGKNNNKIIGYIITELKHVRFSSLVIEQTRTIVVYIRKNIFE